MIIFENPEALYIYGYSSEKYYSDLDARGIEHPATNWQRDLLTLYQDLERISPNYRDVRYRIGRLKAAVSETERNWLEAWRASNPQYQSNKAYKSGWQFIQQKRWADAEAAFRLSIAHDPNNHEAWWNLGYVLEMRYSLGEAAEAYRKGLALFPNDAVAQGNLAAILFRLGDHRAALDHARKSIDIPPVYPRAYSTMARALECLGRDAEAEQAWLKAIELKPDNSYWHDDLGRVYERQGKLEKAVNAFQRAYSLNHDDWEIKAHLSGARDKIRYGRWEKARVAGQETPLSKVQDTLSELVSPDPSVVDLTDLGEGRGRDLTPQLFKHSMVSMKMVDVPSPAGFKSPAERQEQLARLSDEQIDREIKRMGQTLERMKAEFLEKPKALGRHLEQARHAEKDAMMSCFQAMLSASVKNWEDCWDKYPRAKMLAEQGLRYLSYEDSAAAVWKNPGDPEAGIELARTYLLDLYEIVRDFDPELIKKMGPPAAGFVDFLVEYSYQVGRWSLAREQIRIITKNLDAPGGQLKAQKAIGRLYEDLIRERKRRGGSQTLKPKGL